MRRPRSKYGNRKTPLDGHVFDSAREARRWSELRLLERAGLIRGLERQVSYPLVVNGVKVCEYRADFRYTEGGQVVVEDAKGYRTREFILKKKLVWVLY